MGLPVPKTKGGTPPGYNAWVLARDYNNMDTEAVVYEEWDYAPDNHHLRLSDWHQHHNCLFAFDPNGLPPP